MPRYEAGALIFIGSELIEPGQLFESDIAPGRNWVPLDDAAREAVARQFPRGVPEIGSIERQPSPAPGVDIPADWRERAARAQIYVFNLAKRLVGNFDAPEGMTKIARAYEIIEAEVARRAGAQPVVN